MIVSLMDSVCSAMLLRELTPAHTKTAAIKMTAASITDARNLCFDISLIYAALLQICYPMEFMMPIRGTIKLMSMMPMKNNGVSANQEPIPHAISGRKIICPMSPAIMGRGRWMTMRKSEMCRVRPMSNINIVSMGNTMNIVFIVRCVQ